MLDGGFDPANLLTHRFDIRLLAETGGKNATIVTAMADRDQAIKNVIQSAFSHSGQKCSATSLLILEGEVFDDPQVQHLGMAQSVHHPVRGDVSVVAQPLTLSRTPASLRTAVPEAGEHTDDVLEQFGIDPTRIAALRDAGAI